MADIICRPYITLRNGVVLWAHEKGLEAFCFEAREGYQPKNNQPVKEEPPEQSSEGSN